MDSSFWLSFSNKKSYPKVDKDIKTQCAIIGGGISGLLIAIKLSEVFDDIVIVDQSRLYSNTSSHTTAKVTFQHGFLYADLIQQIGLEKAKLYIEAQQEGINYLLSLIDELNIDCDLEDVNSFLYALDKEELKMLIKEEEAYRKLGIDYSSVVIDLPFKVTKALKIKNQFMFNVVKFLDGIINSFDNNKIKIYEDTKIVETKVGDMNTLITNNGFNITSEIVINASHFPVYKGFNFYFLVLAPSISYACVGKPNIKIPEGIYINCSEPIRSFRKVSQDNEDYLLIVGSDGNKDRFHDFNYELEKVKEFGRHSFKITNYKYLWYAQDYYVPDLLPLIGEFKASKNYIATGYNKWGMSNSAIASLIIYDEITKGSSKYSDLFSVNRSFINIPTIKYVFKMGKTYIKSKLIKALKDYDLKEEEGKIIKFNNKKYGIYKDCNGDKFIVKPICPHMKCTLQFNNVSKTYDCPCHGSRFRYDGKCIDGPSTKDLLKITLK